MERIKALLAERKDDRSRDEIIRAALATINPVISAIFDDMPQVNVICIKGYTPHFNDGDPCEWSIYTSVDWLDRDEMYFTPIYLDSYGDDEDESEFASLFSKRDPGWETRKKEPDYDDLLTAQRLLNTLSYEFEVIDDQQGGTWWLFLRDETEANGFSVQSDTFDHD